MIWYTSDLHFGHENVIKFDQRPFRDVSEMNQVLIDNWNRRVKPEDDVYILGDFCFRSPVPPSWYLEQLKGRKHLIIGNHDGALLKDHRAMRNFESVDKMMFIKDAGRVICMCHFPVAEWNGFYKGSWHIYGHIHNRRDTPTFEFMKTRERALNAGCMIHEYAPVCFGELLENHQRFVQG